MTGQNQYIPSPQLTPKPTPARDPRRLADPGRFSSVRRPARPGVLVFVGALVFGALLAGAPGGARGVAITTLAGGALLSMVLGVTLPSRAERAGAELARRLGQFRHEVNAVGDDPARADLERLLGLARQLNLREDEIADDLARIRASLGALTLREDLLRGAWPTATCPDPLSAADTCYFFCPVRFGRRRADQYGHLVLTHLWLKFRGALDMSVAWSEVASVARAERELIVGLRNNRRTLRFSCQTLDEAARGGVIATERARLAAEAGAPSHPASYDAV